MRWSYRIGRVFGTDVKVHVTFFLLVALEAFDGFQSGGPAAAADRTAFLLALFACVVAHEFGHILMARRFGVETRDVILLPIGGLARLDRMPSEPRQELLIALAGPAVTLVIAVLLYLVLGAGGSFPSLAASFDEQAPFFNRLMALNGVLLVFNMIPAFPMDGGRVLRALLASRMGLGRATRIAAGVGQALAVAMGLFGLANHATMWVLIAIFVFIGAGAEASATESRLAGQGVRVDGMMVTYFRPIPIHARLRQAVDMLLEGEQREFPVVDNAGKLEGLLTRENIIRGLSARGPEATVGEVMSAPVPSLNPGDSFDAAFAQLRASGLHALPVVNEGREPVGLLTMDNVAELVLVKRAMGGRKD